MLEIEAVDPAAIPQRTLFTGAQMPAIGLGTFGSDAVPHAAVAAAVRDAAALGYRHFDCAAVYGNEALIGDTLREVMAGGVAREELWVTSKLWNDKHAEEDVLPACRQTLADLQLNYLDLYLIHWPFPNHHDPGVDVHARREDAQPYIHANYMKTWRQMEKLVEMGLVRHIGASNMTVAKLRLLLGDAAIPPAANEMELHPHFQQPELFDFVRAHGVAPIAYSPLGSPGRPERDRTPADTVDMDDPVVLRTAQRHGIHPAAVCIKWSVQRGATPIPFSVRRRNYLANLRAAANLDSAPLTDAEMEEMGSIDRNCRLIKGQVFLWKPDQDWQDLWDVDGKITPP
jgi:diketogulonate reductase-like aldo/keto reductase